MIGEELKCNHCKKVLCDPVSLNCCGENVCKQHIDELSSSKNKECMLCGKDLPNQEFHINKCLKNIIEREKNQDCIKQLNEPKEGIFLNDPNKLVVNEFVELNNRVELDRENAIREINHLADEIRNKLDFYECKSKKNPQSNLDHHYYLVNNFEKKNLTKILVWISTKIYERTTLIQNLKIFWSCFKADFKI